MTYTKEQALAALAAAPDEIANHMGFWREPDGTVGDWITREEWRQGLLDGSTDPGHFMRALGVLKVVHTPGALDRAESAHKDRRRREVLHAVSGEDGDADELAGGAVVVVERTDAAD